MIEDDNILEDNLKDDITKLISRLRSFDSWNKEKRLCKEELINKLESKNYIMFWGHYSRYKIQRIGQSYLYRVPENKRGHLKPYRGMAVRVVCVGQNRFDRLLMVGIYD